jgi:molecular chaperone Hsp33
MGTVLLAAFREEQATTQVTFKGQGPLGELQAIATSEGTVKGKVQAPQVDPPLNAAGKLNVSSAIGKGFLAVVRNHHLMAQPYTGMVPITSGEIAEDLAHYLANSEQQNCALGLGVSVGRDGEVLSAGGFLIQVLPFATDETLSTLESNIASFGAVSERLQEGLSARQIVSQLLGSLEAPEQGFALTPSFGPCGQESLEGRMKRAVAALGAEEVASIVAQEGKVEVTCEFCQETLVLDHEQMLRDLGAVPAS